MVEAVMNDVSDEELVDRYQTEGDQYAAYLLYDRYSRMIERIGRKVERETNHRVSADDMISNMNDKFYRSLMLYKPSVGVTFGSYLFMRNRSAVISTVHRQKKTVPQITLDGDDETYEMQLKCGVQESALEALTIEDPLRYLSEISDELVEVAKLRMKDSTYEQIAKAFGGAGSKATLRKAGMRRVEVVKQKLTEYYRKNDPQKLRGYAV